MLVYRWQVSQDSPGVGIGKGKWQREGEELADTGVRGQILQREARVPRCHGVLPSQGGLWAPLGSHHDTAGADWDAAVLWGHVLGGEHMVWESHLGMESAGSSPIGLCR